MGLAFARWSGVHDAMWNGETVWYVLQGLLDDNGVVGQDCYTDGITDAVNPTNSFYPFAELEGR